MKSEDVASHDPQKDMKSEDFYAHLDTSALDNCFKGYGEFHYETYAHRGHVSTDSTDASVSAVCTLQIRVPLGRSMFLEVTNASQKHIVSFADLEDNTGQFNEILAEHVQDSFYRTTSNGVVVMLKVANHFRGDFYSPIWFPATNHHRDIYVNFRFVTVSDSEEMETVSLDSSHMRIKHGNE
jgi:hypothetical protein